jgi:adenine deaminase
MEIKANLVDVVSRTIFPACVTVADGKIISVAKVNEQFDQYILPGLIDSHVHIESSLLLPATFARVAISHGTVATVSDPHEIANVCGVDGVNFMIRNGHEGVLKFFWTAPSCVPATSFETAGAVIGVDELKKMFENPEIVALGEMMNYPGVIFRDASVLNKIEIAKEFSKVVDGHAPGLMGEGLDKYVSAGISTDHECSTLNEALEKIKRGMKILIREGSSAKNFEALWSLLNTHPDMAMLCSDDLHADDLLDGHLNKLIKRSLALGVPFFNVLRSVTLNPVLHYGLSVGLLRVNDPADFILVDNLVDFNVMETWINGQCVFKRGENSAEKKQIQVINHFNSSEITAEDLALNVSGSKVRVIGVEEGSIETKKLEFELSSDMNSFLQKNQILKLVVKDRYQNLGIGKAFVNGFGNFKGAIASTVAHDSHNIIAVGSCDDDIVKVINLIVKAKGGIAFVNSELNKELFLPLPVAGLMSDQSAELVSERYSSIIEAAQDSGCVLKSPLMTLSFLALLVIPSLKLSDKGLFDVNSFSFTELFFD